MSYPSPVFKTVNTYDSENRLVKTVTYEDASTTSNGLTTRYVYNADGNLIQTVYPHQYNSVSEFQNLNNTLREKYIKKFHKSGISIRQISRLCGESKGIVEKCLN